MPGRFVLLSSCLLIAACGQRDPYRRTDVWRPTGANAANLAAMVANPHDLISGRGARYVDTKASTIAIGHIWSGEPRPLNSGASSAGAGGSQPAQLGAGSGAGASASPGG